MKKVLIADDEEHIARLIEFKLKKEGFATQIAGNGEEAMAALLTKEKFDLVILDVMMPKKDGWQVLQEIRSNQSIDQVPILILTAKSYDRDRVNAAELGATQFLKKPFNPADLYSTVMSMLSANNTGLT